MPESTLFDFTTPVLTDTLHIRVDGNSQCGDAAALVALALLGSADDPRCNPDNRVPPPLPADTLSWLAAGAYVVDTSGNAALAGRFDGSITLDRACAYQGEACGTYVRRDGSRGVVLFDQARHNTAHSALVCRDASDEGVLLSLLPLGGVGAPFDVLVCAGARRSGFNTDAHALTPFFYIVQQTSDLAAVFAAPLLHCASELCRGGQLARNSDGRVPECRCEPDSCPAGQTGRFCHECDDGKFVILCYSFSSRDNLRRNQNSYSLLCSITADSHCSGNGRCHVLHTSVKNCHCHTNW